MGQTWPPVPPTTWGGYQDGGQIWSFGLLNRPSLVTGAAPGSCRASLRSAGCHYSTDGGQPIAGANIYKDISASFPLMDSHGNSTTGPVLPGAGQSMAVRKRCVTGECGRHGDEDPADTAIHSFVIGLINPHPVASRWMRTGWPGANDPGYRNSLGTASTSVWANSGMYFNVNAGGLAAISTDRVANLTTGSVGC